jgi:hypothetical protein
MNCRGGTTPEGSNSQNAFLLSPPKAQYSRSAVIEHHAAAMSVVAQVLVPLLCSSHVDEVIRIRGDGSVFNLDRDLDYLSNADISEILSLDDDHVYNNAGEEEVMLSLAKSNNPGH